MRLVITRTIPIVLAAATMMFVTSCTGPLMKLPPTAAAAAAADGREAFEQATAACRAITAISAEVGVKGSIGGRRVRARLITGLSAPASLRLEAFATGQPLFFFVARDADSTLLLPGAPGQERVLRGAPPDQVLDALTGLRVTPADLRMTLTGCASDEGVANARASGDWRIVPGAATSYLRRDNSTSPWHIVTATRRDSAGVEWRADYKRFVSGLPTEIRLTSPTDGRFDLQLTLSQIDTAAGLGPEVFRLPIPAGAQPISLEELRTEGPLGR